MRSPSLSRLLSPALTLLLLTVVLPAAAQGSTRRACFVDTLDDTVTQQERRPTDTPEADITTWCVERAAQDLGLSIAVRSPTDPAVHDGWADQSAGVAFRMTSDDGTPVVVNLIRPRGGEELEFFALTDQRVPTPLCDGLAATDEEGWSAQIPVETCFGRVGGLPDVIEVAAAMHWDLDGDTASSGVIDMAPNSGTYSVSRTAGDATGVDRFAGPERIATSIEISVASFPDGSADAIVLARADVFADAVVAAPLAETANAPVLLTRQSTVPAEVMLEIERVLGGAGEVFLLGGPAAIRSSVVGQLSSEGHRVTRLDGDTRFATATRIAEEAITRRGAAPELVMLADGSEFGEALAAGAAAPQLGGVVVLTDGDRMPAATQAFLDANTGVPTLTVGPQAAQALPASDSIAGASPEITACLVALHLARELPFTRADEIVLASAERFPDGLAGGAYAARQGAPLLLSPKDGLVTQVAQFLDDEGPFGAVVLLGGDAALSDAVAGHAARFLR